MSRNIESPPDIVELISRLERRVRNLESSQRIGKTSLDSGEFSVKAGSFVVRDTNNVNRAKMGLLDNGEYGIQVTNANSDTVDLAPLAGAGAAEAVTYSALPLTVGSGEYEPAGDHNGPTVNVYIGESRRCLVISSSKFTGTSSVYCVLGASPNITNVGSGAVTWAATDIKNLLYVQQAVAGGSASIGMSRVDIYAGSTIFPTPGVYEFDLWYVARVNNGYVEDRTLAVIPF